MKQYSTPHLAGLLSTLLIAGCFTSTSDPAQQNTVELPDWLDTPGEEPPATTTKDTDLFSDLVLPNPHRTNPFATDKQTKTASTADTVQLKGFVHVNEPKAILIVDNVLSVVASDQTIRDVRILTIQPPEVVYEQAGIEHSLSLLSK